MKTNKNYIVVCMLLTLFCFNQVFSQNEQKIVVTTKEQLKEQRKRQWSPEVQKKIDAIKAEYTEKGLKLKTDEEREALKKEAKARIRAIKDEAIRAQKEGKEDVSSTTENAKDGIEVEEQIKSIREAYAKKMQNAASDTERGELKKQMMEEIEKLRAASGTTSGTSTSVQTEGTFSNENTTTKKSVANGGISEKKQAASNTLTKSENSLSQGMKTIEKARAKVDAAKEKLQNDMDAGSLSKEAILERQEKIRKVENQINILEAAVNKGKNVNADASKRLQSLEKS